MTKRQLITVDANEAVARIAYQLNEVIAIYPITPASPMGEYADTWASRNQENLWGTVPQVIEMQSEGGAAGAVHGALTTGALATTFTSSQGLLLMLPNMFKIAGELTPAVIHVAARSVATHGLSIFGDHSDVMAARQTGWAMLASASVQEAHDMALISHAATLAARVPFIHFFDGFRTSHEMQKIEALQASVVRAMIDESLVESHRSRGLTPDNPVLRGTAQNPDVFFQTREACNPYYLAIPALVRQAMAQFAELTGREYLPYQYYGAPDAERVIILMGSGCDTAEETAEAMIESGEKVGVLKVRMFRPFDASDFVAALPSTVRSIAVLDRTKEPGSAGEPLYQDVITALIEMQGSGVGPAQMPRIVGGRYGLSSKEFTPAMIKGVFDNLSADHPRNHFSIGIVDDVTHTSLDYPSEFSTESPSTVRAMFFGLGSDGTVGANKNSINIIGQQTDQYAQGYFVYDSKKSGSVTISHLRFGPDPIRSAYLIEQANFTACHQFTLLSKLDVLKGTMLGSDFLLNSPYGPDEVWDQLPRSVQQRIIDKRLNFYVIDAQKVAEDAGLGRRINTVMQACFFKITQILPLEHAMESIYNSIRKSYGKLGDAVVNKNIDAAKSSLDFLYEVKVPGSVTATNGSCLPVTPDAPDFVREVCGRMIMNDGDSLPSSALPADGTWPTGTTRFEKRNIAPAIPTWDADLCIQCGKCVMVCPHAVIRGKLFEESHLEGAPDGFKTAESKWPDRKHLKFALQTSPMDCTGCTLCVEVCPVKNKSVSGRKAINMEPANDVLNAEAGWWEFFEKLPNADRKSLDFSRVKDIMLAEPLFEFSGACAGCGETPYLKLITQLFGDRMLVANATGCSSIYGGNLPTTPWSKNDSGRGPAWSNSLFEDNAEFGLGMRVNVDKQTEIATELLNKLTSEIGEELVEAILDNSQKTEESIEKQRIRVAELKHRLAAMDNPTARRLLSLADNLVRKSVWIIGGDGWAYDIGYGGLDHVIASGRNVNILVMDTEVYSNTGGQASKATPMGAVAKFAAGGKPAAKKDLAMLAMTYGNVYVGRIAMGANDAHTIKVIREAEAYDGPSLILAYSHCIAHGFDLSHGMDQQKLAVQCGHWPLMRYNPDSAEGVNPLTLDSKAPNLPLKKYAYNESRYTMLAHSKPQSSAELLDAAQQVIHKRWELYEKMAVKPAVPNTTTEDAGKDN